MPAVPGARFAMIEPGLALGGLEAFLNRPAQTGDGGEFRQFGDVWAEGHIERHVRWIGDRATDQQPMVPRGRLQAKQTKPSPVIEPRPFGSLACGQAPPFVS